MQWTNHKILSGRLGINLGRYSSFFRRLTTRRIMIFFGFSTFASNSLFCFFRSGWERNAGLMMASWLAGFGGGNAGGLRTTRSPKIAKFGIACVKPDQNLRSNPHTKWKRTRTSLLSKYAKIPLVFRFQRKQYSFSRSFNQSLENVVSRFSWPI